MQWPTLIVDDFFTDPHAVVKLSKTLSIHELQIMRGPVLEVFLFIKWIRISFSGPLRR